MPAITATPIDDGYLLSAGSVRLGTLFRVEAGWVTAARGAKHWRRSRPYPTAAEAAFARWGAEARSALPHETSRVSVRAG